MARRLRRCPVLGDLNRSVTLTPACSCSLCVTAMFELGDRPSLLELTHGTQDLAHHLRGGRGVGNIESGKGAGDVELVGAD
jgi:hypothetical protein